jgi:DNA-binding NtrC family response regulator
MGKSGGAPILVVDDDPGIREALHLILDDDYEVIDAVDGDQALAVLASRKIDLILLDLVMQHRDGFEVLEGRSEEHKKVPIIVLSGLNNAWTTAAAMRLGAVDYVTKPFDGDDLLGLIRDTLTSPAGRSAQMRVPTICMPSVLLVGLDLGMYASLTVLLRQQCRVVRAETVIGALSSPGSSSATILVIDLVSLGLQGTAILPRLRGHFTNAEFVIIDTGDRSSVAYKILKAPARVTDLLGEVCAHLTTNGSPRRQQYGARVGSTLNRLGTHFVDASVRQLARAIGASPNHLSVCFREEMGLPLKAYMTELRIEAAKWLLIEAGEKIEAAALRVGLHDASHLSRLFVRYAGTRPGAYRRSIVPAS